MFPIKVKWSANLYSMLQEATDMGFHSILEEATSMKFQYKCIYLGVFQKILQKLK